MSELGCPARKWTEASHAKLVNGYMTPAPREVATGLRFPEGPVAMPDGSVILAGCACSSGLGAGAHRL